MSKSDHELASEILQELLKARGQALSGMGGTIAHGKAYWLDDSHVVTSYKAIVKAIQESR